MDDALGDGVLVTLGVGAVLRDGVVAAPGVNDEPGDGAGDVLRDGVVVELGVDNVPGDGIVVALGVDDVPSDGVVVAPGIAVKLGRAPSSPEGASGTLPDGDPSPLSLGRRR